MKTQTCDFRIVEPNHGRRCQGAYPVCPGVVTIPFPKVPFLRFNVHQYCYIYLCQVFGRKKSATAVAYCKRGKGLIKVNGRPLELVQPEALSFKLQEPILLLGKDRSGLLNTLHFHSMMNFIFTDLFRTNMLQKNT